MDVVKLVIRIRGGDDTLVGHHKIECSESTLQNFYCMLEEFIEQTNGSAIVHYKHRTVKGDVHFGDTSGSWKEGSEND